MLHKLFDLRCVLAGAYSAVPFPPGSESQRKNVPDLPVGRGEQIPWFLTDRDTGKTVYVGIAGPVEEYNCYKYTPSI